jgi:hypothetical protein
LFAFQWSPKKRITSDSPLRMLITQAIHIRTMRQAQDFRAIGLIPFGAALQGPEVQLAGQARGF